MDVQHPPGVSSGTGDPGPSAPALLTWAAMAASKTAPGRKPGPAADPDQRVELLRAAAMLLAQEGPGALTVRRIAAEAGYSTMGVYSRFGGKDGIVEALFVEGFHGLGEAMTGVPETDDPLTDMLGCGRAYRRFALDHPTSYAVMFERVVPGYEPTESAQIIANGTFELLVGRVRRAMELGALPAADAPETAQRIWAACHGWVSLEIHGLIKIDDPDGAAFERSMVALCGPIELSAPPPRATRASAPRSTRRRG